MMPNMVAVGINYSTTVVYSLFTSRISVRVCAFVCVCVCLSVCL